MSFREKLQKKHERNNVFSHCLLQPQKITDQIIEGKGRLYTLETGEQYWSVTTVLGKMFDSSWIEEWKDRVGEDKVETTLFKARNRGTDVHSIVEKYCLNDPLYIENEMPYTIQSFKQIQPFLDKIDVVYGIEIPVYSHRLKIAGRIDGVALFKNDDNISIFDIKTAKRYKKYEDILSYKYQVTLYSIMLEEMYGIYAPVNKILFTVDDSINGVCYEVHREKYETELIERLKGLNHV